MNTSSLVDQSILTIIKYDLEYKHLIPKSVSKQIKYFEYLNKINSNINNVINKHFKLRQDIFQKIIIILASNNINYAKFMEMYNILYRFISMKEVSFCFLNYHNIISDIEHILLKEFPQKDKIIINLFKFFKVKY